MKRVGPLLLAVSLALAGCSRSAPVPLPPSSAPAVAGALPISQIDVPIEVDLELVRAFLERQIPKAIDHEDEWERDGGKGLRYLVERGPIDVGFEAGELRVRAQLSYRARACIGVGRWCQPVASCGYGDDGMRTLDLTLATPVSLSPKWNLKTRTREEHDFVDPCKVSFLRVDIRKHLDRKLRKELKPLTRALDRHLAARARVRERAAEAWKKLQEPIRVRDRLWLVLAPEAVRVSPARGDRGGVRFVLGVDARPRLVGGDRPEAGEIPLPPLQRGDSAGGFALYVQAELPWDEATRLLREQLVGKRFEAGGHRSVIHDVSLAGSAEGALVRLDLETDRGFFRQVRGTVYVVARPTWDPATGVLSLDQLDYSLETKNAAATVAEFLLHPDVLDYLRGNARWQLGEKLDEARRLAAAELNRPLAPGVGMRGALDGLEGIDVVAGSDGFVASVAVRGTASLSFEPKRLPAARAARL